MGVYDVFTPAGFKRLLNDPVESETAVFDRFTPSGFLRSNAAGGPPPLPPVIVTQFVNDADTFVSSLTNYIVINSMTATRNLFLPAVYPARQPLYISDENGLLSQSKQLVVTPIGANIGEGDGIINSIPMTTPYQLVAFFYNGTNLWVYK